MNAELLCEMPKIIYYRNVLTHDECDYVIANINNDQFEKSLGFDLDTKAPKPTNWRTSSQFHDFTNKFHYINDNVSRITKYPLLNIESIQILRYEPGEYYKPHCDFFNFPPTWHTTNNDRVATAITYLNDDFEGGYTNFPNLKIEVKPEKGSMLFFEYKYDIEMNRQTVHGGMSVLTGAKYIATSWIRGSTWIASDA